MKTNKLIIYGLAALLLLVFTGYLKLPTTGGAGSLAGGAGGTGCILATTQTISNASYDADKPGTAVGSATVVYTNPTTGGLNPGGLTTSPGNTYTLYFSKGNYFADVKTITTDCSPSQSVVASQKAVDTSLSKTAYDNDGLTALTTSIGTGNNLTIGSGGSATAHIKLAQSASYKHLSGPDGRFAVFVNATNVTDWAPANFAATFNNVPCVTYGNAGLDNTATPTALGGVVVAAFVCTGDFAAQDGSIHDLSVKYTAASSTNPGGQGTYVNIVGIDAYQDTITGALKMKGAVKDSGAAIQAMQEVFVQVD